MIVDSGINIALAVGQDRRIIQEGDAQLVIPPTIMPVLLGLQATEAMPGITAKPQGSFIFSFEAQIAPGGPASNQICNLAKGLWELELSLSSKFTFNAPLFESPNAFTLSYQGNPNIVLLNRYSQIGCFVDYNRLRVLLTSDAQLNRLNGVVPAGQASQITWSVNAIRIL